MIDIKDISGNIRFSAPINEGSKRKYTLMKEDYITLKFSLSEPIYFNLGDGIDNQLGKFELVDIYNPVYNPNTGGYDYNLRLDAYYWKWKNKIFKYTPEVSGQEASWNLTASLDVQAGIVLRNLKALGYKYKGQDFVFSIDSTVENKSQSMSYKNINILDACFSMAKKWDCECWITENIIHFGRCEFGDPVDFEIDVNVEEMTRSENRSTFATRIYAFGSTRNIPSDYRPVDESVVVNGVVQKRLMLPVGTPYIDAYPNMSIEEAVEQVVVFDDICPRRVGTMSDITTHPYEDTNEDTGEVTKWNAYRFKDTGIKFSEGYVLEGGELKIVFKSGTLNGMTFAVRFNPEGAPEKLEDGSWNPAAQLWEIIRNEDYGRKLPGDVLIPANGDTYVLYGWDSTKISELGLVAAAENELKAETEKYIAKSKIDPSNFNCKMMPSDVYSDGVYKLYEVGDRVKLINKAFFENGRQSRIIGFEYDLDIPYDHPVYTVGETSSYSRIGELEEKVESITLKGQIYTGSGGSGIYVIGVNDSTKPSNRNVYSSLNSDSRYVSKKKDDIAEGHITLSQGVYVKGGTTGDGQSILEEDNSIIEEGNGIVEDSLSVPSPEPLTLGGLDNVDDVVDVPSNKDVILVKKAGSSEWTQEDKTVSDTIPEAPKDGNQYARQDGAWSKVKTTSVDVPTKLSQLENDADYVQDPDYIHTDNNFSTLLKGQLSDLSGEYLDAANRLNYQRARVFFSKTHADTGSVWGFVRYLNNIPSLTETNVRITGVRSDFNGDQISDSYVNIPGATQTSAGVMTASDKAKLDGIDVGATRVIVDSLMSDTSLNPVQNKVITSRFIQVEGRATNLETQYSVLSNTLSPISVAWNKRGTKDGFLILGENGIISSQHLPSYVDDVVDVYATYDKSVTGVLSNIKLYTDSTHTTAVVPESGKIYIDITSGKPPYQFRWSGTTYIDLNTGGLVLGTIAGTAFEGDKGNILYTNFGEGENLLYTQKARDFFKSLSAGVAFISNLEVGTVSETSANLVYDSNVFGATTNRIPLPLPVADSKKAGIISAYDKIFIDDIKSKADKFVTLDTDQTITGVKKITSYLSFVSGDRKININGEAIKIYPYPIGGSAQGINFCNSDGDTLATFGSMVNNNALTYLYIGTGYDESKNWVTLAPSKTTIRNNAEVKGALFISKGTSGGAGVLDVNGNGLVMYEDNSSFISRGIGTTYVRSGDYNLYHRRSANDYIILDLFNTPNPFCFRGFASASHVDLTSTSTGATGFVNYNSGSYMVSRGGSTAMYIKFQGAGSTSGLELYTNYTEADPLKFRKIVDNNRISGGWLTVLDNLNWSNFVRFEKLSDKPLISIEKSSNSLVKRSTNGEVFLNNAPLNFTEQSTYEASQNAWTIATNGTGGNMFINQKKGTGGNLLLNNYRVATAKDKYVMSRYDIDASGLDEDTYYPVTIKLTNGHNYRIEVLVQLDSGTKPSWSTHANGFAVRFIEEVQGNGWGTVTIIRRILDFHYSHCKTGEYPLGAVSQMTNSSNEVIYVRGGGKYFFYVSGSGFNTPEPVLRTSTYTDAQQSVSPVLRSDISYNLYRNMIMSDDVSIAPTAGKIARRDDNGFLQSVRFYTTTPVEDTFAISHVPYFYNSDGFIRKCTLDRFNRQLYFKKLIILTAGSNELNFIPDNYNNSLWFNLKTANGNTNASIETYLFGDGAGWYSNVTAKGFKRYGSTDRYALTGAGGHMLITQDKTANALVQRNASGYIIGLGFIAEGATGTNLLSAGGSTIPRSTSGEANTIVQRTELGHITAVAYNFQGSSAVISPNAIELFSSTTPYIDFHYGNSSDDYTTRIIEDGKSHLQIYANAGIRTSGNITAPGFNRVGSSDSFVLLGGGGHKFVSDFVDRTSNQNISGIKNFFTTAVDGNYSNRAIILRETNMGKDANKSNLYAPSIGFHWGNITQAIMSMHTNGNFHFTHTTTDSGNYVKLCCSGIVKQDSGSDYALTGDGGHVPFSIDANAHSLVKRTDDGSIRVKDVISSNYQLHTDTNNPYLLLKAVSNSYYIQAAASGIWMGTANTANSLIISPDGYAGFGILPSNRFKMYVNGSIRSAGFISAGEYADDAYGYINVTRPNTIENASCFSWVRNASAPFALGFNSSNQIVLGQGKSDKTLNPWLKIGASSSQFQSHLNTQTVSTEDGRFNHDLASMTSTQQTVTGTICISLPHGWYSGMNMYEIYIYEYGGSNPNGSRLLVSGYDYSGGSMWYNYGYVSEGNYDRGVRLGYKDGKDCILLGNTSQVWSYPQIYLANVYAGYSRVNEWKYGYTISVLTSESDITKIVTLQRSISHSFGFMKDGSNNNRVLLGGGGDLTYSEDATNSTLAKRTSNGYLYASFFHQSSSVDASNPIANIIFNNGTDGFFRKATLGRMTDSMRVATQTVKGLMSAEDKKKVDLFDPSKYIRRDIDDDAFGHLTFHAGIYVDGGVYSGQSIMEADGVNGIMESNGNNIIEYSEPAPVAVSMTLGELTNVSSSVNTAASSKVMFVKGAGETLWTQEVITPNVLKGFADTRTVATTPNDYNNKFTVAGLKSNSTLGITSYTYSYLIGYRGWMDSSGGKSHELAFNDNGIYHRIGATTSWESWYRILTSGNWNSYITIPTALKNPNAITFTGAVTGTYDGSSAKTVNIPSMPDLTPYAKKDFSNVTTESLAQNGYCKFPNGLLIQWGYVSSTTGMGTVNFPVAFYNTSYSLSFAIQHNTTSSDYASVTVAYTSVATGSFGYKKGFVNGGTGSASTRPFYWQAIGRWK